MAAGIPFPGGAHLLQRVTLLIATLLVYRSLVGISVQRDRIAQSTLPVLAVLLISYLVVPPVGVPRARLSLDDGTVPDIVWILGPPATAGSTIVWTGVARGNVEPSVIATLSSLAVVGYYVSQQVVSALLVGTTHARHGRALTSTINEDGSNT